MGKKKKGMDGDRRRWKEGEMKGQEKEGKEKKKGRVERREDRR